MIPDFGIDGFIALPSSFQPGFVLLSVTLSKSYDFHTIGGRHIYCFFFTLGIFRVNFVKQNSWPLDVLR